MTLIQFIGRFNLSILILYFLPINLFSESIWMKGAVVTKNGYIVDGEYAISPAGIYLRNDGVGKQISSDEIQSIVTLDYARKVNNSSPKFSALESIYYFNASSKYRYSEKGDFSHQDQFAFTSKVTTLAFALYFFSDALKKREAVSNSVIFLNYEQRKNEFQNSRDYFYGSSAVFLGLVVYYAVNAFLSFDTNLEGEKTGSFRAKEINLKDYMQMQFPEKSSLLYPGDCSFGCGGYRLIEYGQTLSF